VQLLGPIALIVGVVLLVVAVAGLAGAWWSIAAAGAALIVFAVLDERGRQVARRGEDAP
jgi:hypothetical protein